MSGNGRRKPREGLNSSDYSDENWNKSKKPIPYDKNYQNLEKFNDRSQNRGSGGNTSYNHSADNTNKKRNDSSPFYHNRPKKGAFVESELPKHQQGNRGSLFAKDSPSMGSLNDPITPSNPLDNNTDPVSAYPQYNDVSMFYGNDGALGQPCSNNFSQQNSPYPEWKHGPQNSFDTPETILNPYGYDGYGGYNEYGRYDRYDGSPIAGNTSYPAYMSPKPIVKLPPAPALEGTSTIDKTMDKSIAPAMPEEVVEEICVHIGVDNRKHGGIESSRYVKPQSPISDQEVLSCIAQSCSSSGIISEEKGVDGPVMFEDESGVDDSLSNPSVHLEEKEADPIQSPIQQSSKTEQMTQDLGQIDTTAQDDGPISSVAAGKQVELAVISDNDTFSEAFNPAPGEVGLEESDAAQESIEYIFAKIGMVASRPTECTKCLKRKDNIQAMKHAMSRLIQGRKLRPNFLGACEVLLQKWASDKEIRARQPDECENCQKVLNEVHQGRKIEYFTKCCYPAGGGYYTREIPEAWRAYRGLDEAIQAIQLMVPDSPNTEQEAGDLGIDGAETQVKNHRQHLKADEPAIDNQRDGLESESVQVISDASTQTIPVSNTDDFETMNNLFTEFQITEAAGLEVKNQRLLRKIHAISKEKDSIELEVTNKNDEINILSKKNQDIRGDLEKTRGELSVAKQQNEDDRRINSVLRQDVKTYKGAAEKANSDYQQVYSDLSSEQRLRTTTEASLREYKYKFETEQKDAIALGERMAKVESEKKILEKDNENLMMANESLAARNTNLKTRNEELRTSNTKFETQKGELKTSIENVKRDLATQEQVTKDAQAEAKKAREDLDALQITVDQHIATINSHNSLISRQNTKISQLEEWNRAIRQENEDLGNRLMVQFTQQLEDLTEKNMEAIKKLKEEIYELRNPDVFFDAEDPVMDSIHENLQKVKEDIESAKIELKSAHEAINECKNSLHYAQHELPIMSYQQPSFWLTSFVCFLFLFSAFNNKVIPGIFQLAEPATQDSGLDYDFLSQPDNKGLNIPETWCNLNYIESSQALQTSHRISTVALHSLHSPAAGLNSAKKILDMLNSSGTDSAEETIPDISPFMHFFEGVTHAFDTPQKVAVWGFLGGVSYLTYQYIYIR